MVSLKHKLGPNQFNEKYPARGLEKKSTFAPFIRDAGGSPDIKLTFPRLHVDGLNNKNRNISKNEKYF